MGNVHRKGTVSDFPDDIGDVGSLQDVQRLLAEEGLEATNLIIGIDFTISNVDAGKKTFFGKSLHSLSEDMLNPYQQVIKIIGNTLEPFDMSKKIPAFGFGDKDTTSVSVRNLHPELLPCEGCDEVLRYYADTVNKVNMAGPTSFAPLINEALKVVKNDTNYHYLLLIIADGQVTPDNDYCKPYSDTVQAIVKASKYPLSIVMIGVGDGPWDQMEEFDDELPQRKFDNFQFVPFFKTMSKAKSPDKQEVVFAKLALEEVPAQYKAMRKLKLLGRGELP